MSRFLIALALGAAAGPVLAHAGPHLHPHGIDALWLLVVGNEVGECIKKFLVLLWGVGVLMCIPGRAPSLLDLLASDLRDCRKA